MNKFEQKLRMGKLGESLIARWLKSRGWNILPIYELELDSGKGPQLFSVNDEFVAPDLLVFKHLDTNALWIEAKHKSVFTWHRITQRWTTGIDLRHYEDYLKICELSPWPIWLLFLHQKSYCLKRPNEPWPCPTGLFGQTMDYLLENENHRHDNWGNRGMVYWSIDSLKKLAEISEVNRTQ